MVASNNVGPVTMYYQMSTTNQSFINMHYYLRQKGIENNKFFLALYDPDLDGIDPRDPSLNTMMKRKILRECIVNYWYFIREVLRIPDQGGDISGGKRYGLHRGNLALNFGFIMNWNMFLELPRQHGKTISALCYYLWVFNFGTTNSEIMFMNKKHDDSKMNLQRLKEIRSTLPSYLKMDEIITNDGKRLRASSNVETMTHISNKNKITTKPGARSKSLANSLGRGCTMPLQWYDEYAFIPFNTVIYLSATPAYATASMNAKRNGAPFGILITTTPGDLTTDEGMDAKITKDNAIEFNERYYDFNMKELAELQASNTKSSFFYMKFTFLQLGSDMEYFKKMVVDLKNEWSAIRREVLLEWAESSTNCPFTQQELEVVETFICKEPIKQIPVYNKIYSINIYKTTDIYRHPPIMGVDVSGGYNQDSSSITIIDSETTDVIADFNCNYISIDDLAKVIHELVSNYMPNAIVNVERNGGFGASVLSMLVKSNIKRNLYYELKDRVMEERFNGVKMAKKKQTVREYGYNETKANREKLMEILRDRMQNYKSKFISPIIFSELKTLEVKKNGRIEHSNNAHDDQIFSYLLALYVWYEGENLMENFGLEKRSIFTDADSETEFGLTEKYDDISSSMAMSDNDMIKDQINYINSDTTKSYKQWQDEEFLKDQKSLEELKATRLGRMAYAEKFNVDESDIASSVIYTLPDSVFRIDDGESQKVDKLQEEFNSIQYIR